jgi:acetolactate synthase-1/2/3 large subunit
MYTLQALWTMAREDLKITIVIYANHAYSVLKREFSNLRIGEPGVIASSLFDIARPDLDWVSLAKGMGIPAARATSLESFSSLLLRAFEDGGPSLIEVPV